MPISPTPIEFDTFGGLVTLIDRTDLQGPGTSPDCRNVVFAPGRVGKRPGLTSVFPSISGNPVVTGFAWSGWADSVKRRFVISGDSRLWREYPAGTLLQCGTASTWYVLGGALVETPDAHFPAGSRCTFAKTGTQLIFVIGDGKTSRYRPYSLFVSTSYHNVGQEGMIVQLGQPGPKLPPILTNTGTGVVTAGYHRVLLCGVGFDGSLSPPGGEQLVNAPGSQMLDVASNSFIPEVMGLGPYAAFRIFMTAANGAIFYQAADVLGLPATVNVSDDYLLSQNRLEYPINYAGAILPPSCAAVFGPFNNRVWLARPTNALMALSDVSGSFNPVGLDMTTGKNTVPPAPPNFTGTGTVGVAYNNTDAKGSPAIGNLFWRLIGDGSASPASLTFQYNGAWADLLVGTVKPGLRIWLRKTSGLAQGDVKISLDNTATWATIPYADLSTTWKAHEVTGLSFDAFGSYGVIAADGTPTQGQEIHINGIEIYDLAQPVYASTFLVSDAVSPGQYIDPDSYFSIDEGDGDEVTNAFQLAGMTFACKARSLYRIAVDGGPAAYWSYQKIATDVGTPSLAGVGLGEEYAVICGRSGVWLFWGAGVTEDSNLAKEILPTWQSVNWEKGHLIWCRVDVERKLVFIGVPMGDATEVTSILVLDYMTGWGIGVTEAGVHIPSGRKWVLWDVGAACAEFIERDDGTREFWLGNNAGTGKILKLDEAAFSDDGAAIDSWYEAAPVGPSPALNLTTRLLMDVHGSCATAGQFASLALSLKDYHGDETLLPYAPTLYDPSRGLTRVLTHHISEKTSVKFRNVSTDSTWTLCKLVQYSKPFRGIWGRPLNP